MRVSPASGNCLSKNQSCPARQQAAVEPNTLSNAVKIDCNHVNRRPNTKDTALQISVNKPGRGKTVRGSNGFKLSVLACPRDEDLTDEDLTALTIN